jgi:phosphoadenosine phosphosulfate reductase
MKKMDLLIKNLENLSLEESLIYLSENYSKVVFSSSFGQEDQVITDVIFRNNLNINVFTLDTGRLFQDTYELMDSTKTKYNKTFDTFFPNTQSVEQLVKEKGFNSFYYSVENRKECCFIRKIEPLKRALARAEIWITGLRAEQSENRADMKIAEWG